MTKHSLDEADFLANKWVKGHTNPLVRGDLETHEQVMELARAGGQPFARFLTSSSEHLRDPSSIVALAAGPFEEFLHNCPNASEDIVADLVPHGLLVEILRHVHDLADIEASVRFRIEEMLK